MSNFKSLCSERTVLGERSSTLRRGTIDDECERDADLTKAAQP